MDNLSFLVPQLKVGLTDSSSICRQTLRDRGRQNEKAVNKPTVRPGQAPGLRRAPFKSKQGAQSRTRSPSIDEETEAQKPGMN